MDLRLPTAAFVILLAQSALGETLVCSYPAWAPPDLPKPKEPVVVEIMLDGKAANVRWAGQFDFAQRFQILANTQYGLVISSTYAAPEAEGMLPTIGAYTFLVDRETGAMRYGNFFMSHSDSTSSEGTCLFQK